MKKITPQQRRELAALAQCSDNTLKRWIDGRPMRPTVKARIERAWEQMSDDGNAAPTRRPRPKVLGSTRRNTR